MASRGRGARAKGFAFERDIAKKITEAVGIEFKRGLGQTRNGGEEISDVYSEAVPSIHIEAKRQKRCNIKAALRQAIEDTSQSDKIPIAITKDDRQDILVTMRFEDWVSFLDLYIESTR
jgi:hypothetical protein